MRRGREGGGGYTALEWRALGRRREGVGGKHRTVGRRDLNERGSDREREKAMIADRGRSGAEGRRKRQNTRREDETEVKRGIRPCT